MQVPRLTKIVVNMGVGERLATRKFLSSRRQRFDCHRRSEAGVITKAKRLSRAQDSRRLSGRHHGDAAQQADVRFLDRSVNVALLRARISAEYRCVVLMAVATATIGVKEQIIIFLRSSNDKIDVSWPQYQHHHDGQRTTRKVACQLLCFVQELKVHRGKKSFDRAWSFQQGDKLVAKYATKYAELKAVATGCQSLKMSELVARMVLQKLPARESPTWQRNRCAIMPGRPWYIPSVIWPCQDPGNGLRARFPASATGEIDK